MVVIRKVDIVESSLFCCKLILLFWTTLLIRLQVNPIVLDYSSDLVMLYVCDEYCVRVDLRLGSL
jgi:hypothetical protein